LLSVVNEDIIVYEEFIKYNNKKYLIRIENHTLESKLTYILTIYELKRILFKNKKVQLLRTVANEDEDATISAMIDLGKHYIKTF